MTKNYYINGNTVRELDSPVRGGRKTREEIIVKIPGKKAEYVARALDLIVNQQ